LQAHIANSIDYLTDVGNDDGVDQGLASEEFPLTNGMGNLRRPLNEHAAGATVRSAQGGVVDICLDVDLDAFETEFLQTLRSN
jgi:hypothetical protein